MLDEPSTKLVKVSIDLSPESRQVVEDFKSIYGISKIEAVTRGMKFLTSLPKNVLKEVFDKNGDPIGELVRIRLGEIAAAGDVARAQAGLSFEDALKISRMMLDRLEQLEEARVASFGPKAAKKK